MMDGLVMACRFEIVDPMSSTMAWRQVPDKHALSVKPV
jgi:hypothetical protein